MRILITGGAGFVGGSLARAFLTEHEVVLFDNLRRRGSEWMLPQLTAEGATFVHGDVRNPSDLEELEGAFDLMIEASAEASVQAGLAGSARYLFDTNLGGAINCLEFARNRCGGVVFLSTSRVYSIQALRALPLEQTGMRLDLAADCERQGFGFNGISESFSTASPRSFYGTSKLAAESVIQEYAAQIGLPVVINRCGVIAGPGQFGRTDQGVFTLWVARHHFDRPLRYVGFGGKGLQVRDLLHPLDLASLVRRQIERWSNVSGRTFNIGGGRAGSVSLCEFTDICRAVTGRVVQVDEDPATNAVDIPWYVSDCSLAEATLGWSPSRTPHTIAAEIAGWVREHEVVLRRLIA